MKDRDKFWVRLFFFFGGGGRGARGGLVLGGPKFAHLCVELLVLSEQVDAQLRQPDEVLQLLAWRHDDFAHHLFCNDNNDTWTPLATSFILHERLFRQAPKTILHSPWLLFISAGRQTKKKTHVSELNFGSGRQKHTQWGFVWTGKIRYRTSRLVGI